MKLRAGSKRRSSVHFQTYKNVKIGEIVPCKVVECTKQGLNVILGVLQDQDFISSKLNGFVPLAHIEKIVNKSMVDEIITCRVLNVSAEFKMVGLTNKQSLISSMLPVVSDWSQLKVDLMVHVYVKSVHEKGYVVGLYNDIKGFIQREHLKKGDEDLKIGDVVDARVISTEEDKLLLSTYSDSLMNRNEDKNQLVNAYIPLSDYRSGQLACVEVTEKLEDGIIVRIAHSDSSLRIPLPKHHLSDFLSLAEAKYQYIEPGMKLYVVFSQSSGVSLKEDLLGYSILEDDPPSSDDVHINQTLPGYVSSYGDKDVIVTLPGGVSGHCSKQESRAFRHQESTELNYPAFGKSVIAKVVKMEGNGKVTISLQAKHVGFDHGDYITKYRSALEDFKHEYVPRDFSVKIGNVINIEGKSPDGKLLVNEGKQFGFNGELLDETESSSGPAVVVFINYASKTLILSRNSHVLKYAEKKPHNMINSRSMLFCKVMFVDCDVTVAYISPSSNAEGNEGRLVLFPTHIHQNCVDGETESIVAGNEVMLHAVQALQGGILLCVRRSGKSRGVMKRWLQPTRVVAGLRNLVLSKLDSKERLHQLKIGEKVDVCIESLHPHCACGRIISCDMKGILHASNLKSPATHNTHAMQNVQVGQTLTCFVVGPCQTTPPTSVLHLMDSAWVELSLRQDVIPTPSSIKALCDEYSVGREVTVYVESYSTDDGQFIVSLEGGVRGTVEDFLISDHPEEVSDIEEYVGRTIDCYVTESLPSLRLRAKGTIISRDSGEEEMTLSPGSVTPGKVVFHKSNLVWVRVGNGRGKVDWCDLLDSMVDKPASYFSTGQLVRCFVIETRPSVVLSLKNSHTRMGSTFHPVAEKDSRIESLQVGQIVQGNVISCSEKGVYISYARGLDLMCPLGYSLPGFRPITEISKIFYIGRLVSCKVKKVSAKPVASCLPSHTGIDLEDITPSDQPATIERPSLKRKIEIYSREEAINLIKKFRFEDPVPIRVVSMTTSDDSDDPGFQWDANDDVADEPTSGCESDLEDDQPLTKKSKAEAESKEEEMIRAREEELMDDSLAPQTATDWERLLASDPDNSILWIRYMAFHIHATEIDKARDVAEKALKTINFRKEKEKLNIWVTRLNLENLYGNEETMEEIVRRALAANDQLKLLKHLATIYQQSGKLRKAKTVHEKMVKKFRGNKEVWIAYMRHLMVDHKQHDMQEILQRCLTGVAKKHHLEVIMKSGQLEFKFGDAERGRTIFENLVTTHPKRTDIWSVYVDMMLNTGRLDETRELLSRVTSLKLSSKKTSSFFKRFIEFEMKHGNESTVDEVKRKALNYLEISSR